MFLHGDVSNIFYLIRSILLFTFRIWDQYTSTDEQESDQILYLPNVLSQDQRAKDAGKDRLGKLDDKESGKFSMLDNTKPYAIADDRGDADVDHDQKRGVWFEMHVTAHSKTEDKQNETTEKLWDTCWSDRWYFHEHLFADHVGKDRTKRSAENQKVAQSKGESLGADIQNNNT